MTLREHLMVYRWQELRERGVSAEDRIKDLDQYEAELEAIRRELKPRSQMNKARTRRNG